MQYAQIQLTLESALHIGSGRSGMLAKSHAFLPGHIVSYALAAAIGKAHGGQYEDFTQALQLVLQQVRCGPLFIEDPKQAGKVLLPKKDRESVERQFLMASNHVTLDPQTRSSVDGALFEVEAIASQVVRGTYKGTQTNLLGGLWFTEGTLHERSISDWLQVCLLGGELKTGFGRIRSVSLDTDVNNYAGVGQVDDQGLHLDAGETLPGVALDGVAGACFYPWVGRLFDRAKGAGRALSAPAFVAFDAKVAEPACFRPKSDVIGLGCWTTIE